MPDATGHWRMFVALPLPAEVRQDLARMQHELREQLSPRAMRWSPAEQLHLTLRFLGDVNIARVPALTAALQDACAKSHAMDLTICSLGVFPGLHRPRIVWAGIAEADQQLRQLWTAVQDATNSFCAEPPATEFTGHITLGRIKFLPRGDQAVLRASLERMANHPIGRWRAERAGLMRSELAADGARHTIVCDLPLASPL